jgi:hypothetical protein
VTIELGWRQAACTAEGVWRTQGWPIVHFTAHGHSLTQASEQDLVLNLPEPDQRATADCDAVTP